MKKNLLFIILFFFPLFILNAQNFDWNTLDQYIENCNQYDSEKKMEHYASLIKENSKDYYNYHYYNAKYHYNCLRDVKEAYRLLKIALDNDKVPAEALWEWNYLASIISQRAGDLESTRIYVEEAFKLSEQADVGGKDMVSLYIRRGKLYLNRNEVNQALEQFKAAERLEVKDPKANLRLKAMTTIQIGQAYRQAKRIEEALSYLKKAEALVEKLEGATYLEEKSFLVSSLGSVYVQESKYQDLNKALTYFKENYELSTKIEGRDAENLASAATNLAIAYFYVDDLEPASEYFQKSVDFHEEAYGKHHASLALSYANFALFKQNIGDIDACIELSKKSLIANAVDCEESVNEVDMIELTKKYEFLDPVNANGALHNYANTLLLSYDKEGEISFRKEALKVLEAQSFLIDKIQQSFRDEEDKLHLLSLFHLPYTEGVIVASELFKETKDPEYLEQAFQFLEQNKAVLLSGGIQGKLALNFGQIPEDLAAKEKHMQKERVNLGKYISDAKRRKDQKLLNKLEEELFQLEEEQKDFILKLEKEYPKYHSLKYDNQLSSLKEVQSTLKEHQAVLEYLVQDESRYLFVITQQEVDLINLDFTKEEEVQWLNFREYLSDFNTAKNTKEEAYQNFIKNGYSLYKQLIAPANELIKDKKHLIVVPDALLWQIPFETFLSEEKTGEYKDLPYLLKKYSVSYSYSMSLLIQQQTKAQLKRGTGFLGMAASYNQGKDVDLARTKRAKNVRGVLGDLPAAKNEVQALAKKMQGDLVVDATEADFKEKVATYGMIHLAMHGLLDAENPEFSSLVFTEKGDTLEDNFLFSAEIANLDLKAELVVLSACETGFGKFKRGEGVMSLARAFMHAGVPSVVVSLWQVNDQSTALLMQWYYEALKEGEGKASALQKAKLKYLEEIEPIATHPAFWAAFVHFGDSSTINYSSGRNWYWGVAALGALILGLALFFIFRKRKK